jgi:hypothetical protein
MARMISLLGPPPQDLLDVTPVTKAFFDKTGEKEAPPSPASVVTVLLSMIDKHPSFAADHTCA